VSIGHPIDTYQPSERIGEALPGAFVRFDPFVDVFRDGDVLRTQLRVLVQVTICNCPRRSAVVSFEGR
jgi:hypothetical protein